MNKGWLEVSPVFSSDVGHDVLVEELQDQRDAVGKHQMLRHVLKLQEKTCINTHKIKVLLTIVLLELWSPFIVKNILIITMVQAVKKGVGRHYLQKPQITFCTI